MFTKFKKSLLAISLLASLVAATSAANAGATISDKRYWPNEVGPAAYRNSSAQRAPNDAFASTDRNRSPVGKWRYIGGPKSSVPPSPGF
jgi:hypothetical protein